MENALAIVGSAKPTKLAHERVTAPNVSPSPIPPPPQPPQNIFQVYEEAMGVGRGRGRGLGRGGRGRGGCGRRGGVGFQPNPPANVPHAGGQSNGSGGETISPPFQSPEEEG